MNDEDEIDSDEEVLEDSRAEFLALDLVPSDAGALSKRRKLEERLEEARLRKAVQEYDFD